MQDNKTTLEREKLESDLKLLNLRLATAEAEFEKIQQELLAIESSQTQSSQTRAASKKPGRGITLATASVMAVIGLSFVSVYHDALSNVNESSQYEVSAMNELLNGPIVRNGYQSANSKLSSLISTT